MSAVTSINLRSIPIFAYIRNKKSNVHQVLGNSQEGQLAQISIELTAHVFEAFVFQGARYMSTYLYSINTAIR